VTIGSLLGYKENPHYLLLLLGYGRKTEFSSAVSRFINIFLFLLRVQYAQVAQDRFSGVSVILVGVLKDRDGDE
jgi:hypothetical protein